MVGNSVANWKYLKFHLPRTLLWRVKTEWNVQICRWLSRGQRYGFPLEISRKSRSPDWAIGVLEKHVPFVFQGLSLQMRFHIGIWNLFTLFPSWKNRPPTRWAILQRRIEWVSYSAWHEIAEDRRLDAHSPEFPEGNCESPELVRPGWPNDLALMIVRQMSLSAREEEGSPNDSSFHVTDSVIVDRERREESVSGMKAGMGKVPWETIEKIRCITCITVLGEGDGSSSKLNKGLERESPTFH